jgi:quercetin dioxygenase-like cupin family protein
MGARKRNPGGEMKLVVVGVDGSGHSTVLEMRDLAELGPTQVSERLWETDELPPAVAAPDPGPDVQTMRLTATPTGSVFNHVVLPAGFESPMHRTVALDFGVVLDGDVLLTLERGEVELSAGDAFVNPGVAHKWTAGPRGAILRTVLLGSDGL